MERAKTSQKLEFEPLSAAAILLSALFYLWLESAPGHQPAILLKPIAAFVSGFFSLRFTLEPGIGYRGITRAGAGFIINKTCSGGVFWIICFCLLCLTQTRRFAERRHRLLSFGAFLLLSYLIAVAASILRIIPSILMFDTPSRLDPVLVHNIIGMITFLTMICTSFVLTQRCVDSLIRKLGEHK